jgi:mercuric ion binding protein
MKRSFIAITGALAFAAALLAFGLASSFESAAPATAQSAATRAAAEQTATFTVENMTCALCPVTVKKAMAGVKGVRSVAVDFESKTATVVFDPSVATPDAIAAASTDAGYPAKARN